MAAEPKLRSDLVTSRQNGFVVVKDPATERFFRFREVEHFIASQFDGTTSLGEIRERTAQQFGGAPTAEVVERFVRTLGRLGLLETAGAPVPPARRLRGDLLHLRLAAFDPDPLLERLVGLVRFCFTPSFVAFSVPFVGVALAIAIGQRAEIGRGLAGLYRVETLLLAWLAILAVATAHEFAHGLTCKHFGGHVREMGFLLLYLQPAFYCNVSDAWLFPEKSKRLWVTLAGPYFELVLWAGAVLTWRFTDPHGWLNAMALVVVATSGVRLVFNLNPLIRLDGYYLLSDAVGIPNLRARAFGYVGDRLSRLWRARARPARGASARERWIYLTYGLLAGGYSVWLLGMIAWALGRLLTGPYQGTGAILSAGLLLAVFQSRLKRLLPEPDLPGGWRGRFASIKRPMMLLAGLGVATAVLFLGRVEHTVSGEFTVAPRRGADVRAGPGGLEAVTVDVAIPARAVGDVRVGQPVVLQARARPEASFVGRVTAIDPEGGGARRAVARVTTFVDDGARLREPAMTGEAKIYCGERRIVDLLTWQRIGDFLTRRLGRFLRGGSWW
jgi:hypothetical protein